MVVEAGSALKYGLYSACWVSEGSLKCVCFYCKVSSRAPMNCSLLAASRAL